MTIMVVGEVAKPILLRNLSTLYIVPKKNSNVSLIINFFANPREVKAHHYST